MMADVVDGLPEMGSRRCRGETWLHQARMRCTCVTEDSQAFSSARPMSESGRRQEETGCLAKVTRGWELPM